MLLWLLLLRSQANDPAALEPLEENCVSDQIAGVAVIHRPGAQVYAEVCAACHGKEGEGVIGIFPPLRSSEWVENPELIAQIVLRGLAGKIYVSGQRYASAMPSFAEQLTDDELAGVVSYVQQSFAVSTEGLTTARATELRALSVNQPSISGQSGLVRLLEPSSADAEQSSPAGWFRGCTAAE